MRDGGACVGRMVAGTFLRSDEDAEGEGGDDDAAGSVVERALKRIIQN